MLFREHGFHAIRQGWRGELSDGGRARRQGWPLFQFGGGRWREDAVHFFCLGGIAEFICLVEVVFDQVELLVGPLSLQQFFKTVKEVVVINRHFGSRSDF